MTPFRNRLSPLTKRMAEDMLVRNLSSSTIDSYTYQVDKFLEYFGQSAEELGPAEIREYQLYVIKEKNIGWSSFNQLVSK
jgi:integrase/recombinase XerD